MFKHIIRVLYTHHKDRWGWIWSALAAIVSASPKAVEMIVVGFDYSSLNVIFLFVSLVVAIAFIRNSWVLEQKVLPKLKLVYEETDFYIIDSGLDGDAMTWRYRVGLKNTGTLMLNGCVLKISDIFFNDNSRPLDVTFPIAAKMEHQKGDLQTPFPLRPGETKYSVIIESKESDQTITIKVHSSEKEFGFHQIRDSGDSSPHAFIKLEALSKESTPVSEIFYMFVDNEGRTRFQFSHRSHS